MTDRPTNQTDDRPTDRQTDMRGHSREDSLQYEITHKEYSIKKGIYVLPIFNYVAKKTQKTMNKNKDK